MTAQALAEVSSVCISLRRDFCCKNSELLLWWTHPWPEPSCLEGSQNGNSLGKAISVPSEAQPCHLSHQKGAQREDRLSLQWLVLGDVCVCVPVPSQSPNVTASADHEKNCCACSSSLSCESACPSKHWGVLPPPVLLAQLCLLLWLCGGSRYSEVSWGVPCACDTGCVWHRVSAEHPAVRWQLDIQGYKHEPLQTSRKQSYEITSCFLVAITQLVFKLLGWIPAGGMWHPAGASRAAVAVSEWELCELQGCGNAAHLCRWTPGALQFPAGAAFSPLNDHNCCLILLLWRLLLVSILYQ